MCIQESYIEPMKEYAASKKKKKKKKPSDKNWPNNGMKVTHIR